MVGIGDSKFEVVLCSDLEYEHLVAEIMYDGAVIAIVNQEHGKDHMQLEVAISGKEAAPGMGWIVEFDAFLQALTVARQRLLDREA